MWTVLEALGVVALAFQINYTARQLCLSKFPAGYFVGR